jgi:SAM-dependent methyltransferase
VNKSNDYHDYVFRDGKLVGEFEEMYRNSATLPWHQDEQADWVDVRLTKEMIRDTEQLDQIHDLGCGTGHYLNLISDVYLAPAGESFGYDISETACKKAALNFPRSKFSVLDLTEPMVEMPSGMQVADANPVRLFIVRGTLWYVYPKLSVVVENIKTMMARGDKLLVVQNFPPLDEPFIGKDVIPDHSALINHFSRCFTLHRHIWYEDSLGTSNDNWFIGIFSLPG